MNVIIENNHNNYNNQNNINYINNPNYIYQNSPYNQYYEINKQQQEYNELALLNNNNNKLNINIDNPYQNTKSDINSNKEIYKDQLGIEHDENIFEYYDEKMTYSQDPIISLENSQSAQIVERVNGCKLLFDCSTENEYHIFINENNTKKFLFACYEDSPFCMRLICSKSKRDFLMDVKHFKKYSEFDNKTNIKNYFDIIKPLKCPCSKYCRPILEIYSNSKKFGYIFEPNTFCCDPVFEIYNSKDELRYKFYNDCCQAGFIFSSFKCGQCCEVFIPIYKGNEKEFSNNNIGDVQKVIDENCSGIIAKTSVFDINFPKDASAEDKLLLLMGVILMDYRYYGS